MKHIADFLQDLGLSPVEAKIYIRLLELGKSSITELSHSLQMNRITVHFNIKNLIERGLITHIKHGRLRELTPQPPSTLQYLIEQKQTRVKMLREEFASALPLMDKLIPTKGQSDNKLDVKFFQGKNGVRAIYREVLKSKEIRAYVNISKIFEAFPENSQLFPDAQIHKSATLWEILEDSPRSREYIKTFDPKRYFYKFFPSKWNVSVFDYLIFDGQIAMISGKEELDGIIIQSDNMYQNAKVIFEMLWSLLPKPQ